MELSETDRDKLRLSQQRIVREQGHAIGTIIEHQSQDPKRYKLLSSKSNQKSGHQESSIPYKSKYYSMNHVSSMAGITEDAEPDLPIPPSDVVVNQWLNMDQVEFEKLEWMSRRAIKSHQEKIKGSTLFDKDGRAIPSEQLVSETNHEAKINRDKDCISDAAEGHDIEALARLLDSTYDPQVTYALKVITKIASLTTIGYYDGSFDENLHDILIRNFLLRARHRLDHSNENVCSNAIRCLRALICNTQVDEVVLDRAFPITSENIDSNMWLLRRDMDVEFSLDMKDSECVEKDVILALIFRTDILKRFLYLLRTKTSQSYYTYHESILDILIRMARHSSDVCYMISKADIISVLVNAHLKSPNNKQVLSPSVKVLKLIRIMAQASAERIIYDRMKPPIVFPEELTDMVLVYFNLDVWNQGSHLSQQLAKLNVESIRLMKTLSKIPSHQQQIANIVLTNIERTMEHMKRFAMLKPTECHEFISFDWQFAAHLLDMLAFVMRIESGKGSEINWPLWWIYVKPVAYRWIVEVVRLNIIPHLDVSIAIAAAMNHMHHNHHYNPEELYKLIFETTGKDDNSTTSQGIQFFRKLAGAAESESQLNNFLENNGTLRDPKGLPSYGYLNYNQSQEHKFKLNSIYCNDSPHILLGSIFDELQRQPTEIIQKSSSIVEALEMMRYIRLAANYHHLPRNYEPKVQQSQSVQFELQIVTKAILSLAGYYLNFKNIDDQGEVIIDHEIEPLILTEKRKESYSNLCFYAISALGLIDPVSEYSVGLKDRLFKEILFHSKFPARLHYESDGKAPPSQLRRLRGMNYINGCHKESCLTKLEIDVLSSIYLNCDQIDRLWLFQPLLQYYFVHANSKLPDGDIGRADSQWFAKNTNANLRPHSIAGTTDGEVIRIILKFHLAMLCQSPQYNRMCVQPNIEDHLCLIGTIFLDDEIFLDEGVSSMMTQNLEVIIYETLSRKVHDGEINAPFSDAKRVIEPLKMTLADFFTKLLDQYESVSYGDLGFTNYILLFLSIGSDILFRRNIFQERTETCVRLLSRIGSHSVWAPVELFFACKETDKEMVGLLLRARPFVNRGGFIKAYIDFHATSS